jgi:hypothetical protein
MRRLVKAILLATVLLLVHTSWAQLAGLAAQPNGGKKVSHSSGSFVVKVAPVEASELGKKAGAGRMTIDKTWSGGMEGASQGEMLTSATESTGAMAYVAIERFSGKLDGKSGSFVFTHNATMMKTDPKSGVMQISIVPSSGTGELAGITGRLTITIDATGKHTYELEYQLP